jgi:dynein heavy chain
MGALGKTLGEKLEDYNASHPIMDLVLFDDAMEHVSRIARILSRPGGHALLVGVGGSGKQSLARLAAHICGHEVRQLSITARFTLADLKEALKEMYRAAAVKGVGTVFLLTDSQIVSERFLVPINDLLSSGWVADLFERDELDGLLGSLRGEAKAAGVLTDSPDEMLAFLVSRARANLHVVLCFSPVGEAFRVRARRFPGLINATTIDRFAAWPESALVSVAQRFIADIDLGGPEVTAAVAQHMATVRRGSGAVVVWW